MKKGFFLLMIVLVVGTISGVVSINARVNHVIYVTDPFNADKCNVALFPKSMIPSVGGTIRCTAVANQPCTLASTYDMPND